jgi:hypothetical protein
MSLNRQMALWGLYEGDGDGTVVEAPSMSVGLFNQLMLDFSEGCIYSARETFLCLKADAQQPPAAQQAATAPSSRYQQT